MMTLRQAVLILIASVIFCLAMVAVNARAHTSPSGWPYPTNCCTPDGKECAPIPDSAVDQLAGGKYRVHLKAGDHPHIKAEVTFLVEPGQVRPSGDNLTHACIKPDGTKLHCLIIKTMS